VEELREEERERGAHRVTGQNGRRRREVAERRVVGDNRIKCRIVEVE
jgi:hypothetical protein